jgi:hypothetical protein
MRRLSLLITAVALMACPKTDEECANAFLEPEPIAVEDGGMVVELHLERADWFFAVVQVSNPHPTADCVVAVYQGQTVPDADELVAIAQGESPPDTLPSGSVRVAQANLAAARTDVSDQVTVQIGKAWEGLAIADGTVLSVLGCETAQAEAEVQINVESCDGDPLFARDLMTRHR